MITNHQEYNDNIQDWLQLETSLKGERAIKKAKEKYLPYPVVGVDKTATEYTNLYEIYINGGHFVNFTSEAKSDLVNNAFREPPKIQPEPENDTHLLESSKKLMATVVAYGRSFIMTDFPSIPNPFKESKPYLVIYNPMQVVDWAISEFSGDDSLTLVVLQEETPPSKGTDEPFQYRHLLIDEGVYKVRIYESRETEVFEEFIPTQSNGQHFDFIPGTFVGSINNAPNVDQSVLLGINNSNIKHYQIFSELSQATVYLGQPSLIVSGLPAGFIKQAEANKTKIRVGANNTILLEGDSSQASLLEIDPNLTHYKTLELLENSMSEQGFNLRSAMTRGGAETATTVQLRQASQMSKLGSIVNNVEHALNEVMEFAVLYGAAPTTIEINKMFFPPDVCEMQAGAGAGVDKKEKPKQPKQP